MLSKNKNAIVELSMKKFYNLEPCSLAPQASG